MIFATRTRHRQHLLQNLVRRQREPELWTGPQNPRWPALEERTQPLFPPHRPGTMPQTRVLRLALSRLDLQPRLDHVTGRG